jgi:translation initiation factor IF-3
VKTLSLEFIKLLKPSFAEELEVDLVEISPNAEPPVCKLMDYGKFFTNKRNVTKSLKLNQLKLC